VLAGVHPPGRADLDEVRRREHLGLRARDAVTGAVEQRLARGQRGTDVGQRGVGGVQGHPLIEPEPELQGRPGGQQTLA
jgi:hypothetical protein